MAGARAVVAVLVELVAQEEPGAVVEAGLVAPVAEAGVAPVAEAGAEPVGPAAAAAAVSPTPITPTHPIPSRG